MLYQLPLTTHCVLCTVYAMPRVDIWIRKDDLGAWQAIDNKAEFIHNALQGTVLPDQSKAYKSMSPDEITIKPIIKTPKEAKQAVASIRPSDVKFCKNGHIADDYGRCLQRDCKYSK